MTLGRFEAVGQARTAGGALLKHPVELSRYLFQDPGINFIVLTSSSPEDPSDTGP